MLAARNLARCGRVQPGQRAGPAPLSAAWIARSTKGFGGGSGTATSDKEPQDVTTAPSTSGSSAGDSEVEALEARIVGVRKLVNLNCPNSSAYVNCTEEPPCKEGGAQGQG